MSPDHAALAQVGIEATEPAVVVSCPLAGGDPFLMLEVLQVKLLVTLPIPPVLDHVPCGNLMHQLLVDLVVDRNETSAKRLNKTHFVLIMTNPKPRVWFLMEPNKKLHMRFGGFVQDTHLRS